MLLRANAPSAAEYALTGRPVPKSTAAALRAHARRSASVSAQKNARTRAPASYVCCTHPVSSDELDVLRRMLMYELLRGAVRRGRLSPERGGREGKADPLSLLFVTADHAREVPSSSVPLQHAKAAAPSRCWEPGRLAPPSTESPSAASSTSSDSTCSSSCSCTASTSKVSRIESHCDASLLPGLGPPVSSIARHVRHAQAQRAARARKKGERGACAYESQTQSYVLHKTKIASTRSRTRTLAGLACSLAHGLYLPGVSGRPASGS